jgi:hypothetical protein
MRRMICLGTGPAPYARCLSWIGDGAPPYRARTRHQRYPKRNERTIILRGHRWT